VIPVSLSISKFSIKKYSIFPKTNVIIFNKLGFEKILQVITASAFFDKLTLKQLEIIKQGIPDIEKLNVDIYLLLGVPGVVFEKITSYVLQRN
jgi:hypothetical protein